MNGKAKKEEKIRVNYALGSYRISRRS